MVRVCVCVCEWAWGNFISNGEIEQHILCAIYCEHKLCRLIALWRRKWHNKQQKCKEIECGRENALVRASQETPNKRRNRKFVWCIHTVLPNQINSPVEHDALFSARARVFLAIAAAIFTLFALFNWYSMVVRTACHLCARPPSAVPPSGA